MKAVAFQSVTKVFRHRPALFNFFGQERGGQTVALASVSLEAEPGQVLILLGPNGSGKTTLLKLISAALLPDRGQVIVDGLDSTSSSGEIHKRVAYGISLERSFFARLTARENLHFFAAFDDVPRSSREIEVERVLEITGLAEFADTQAIKFSSGTYQKLGLARALLKRPSVLLLDEPTRSLDPGAAERIWPLVRALADGGTTVVLATHNLDEATTLGDAVAVLNVGCLVDHRPLDSHGSRDSLRSVYIDLVSSRPDGYMAEVKAGATLC